MIPDRKRDPMLNENERLYAVDSMTANTAPAGTRHLAVLIEPAGAPGVRPPLWPDDEHLWCCGETAPPDAPRRGVPYVVADVDAVPEGFCEGCWNGARRIVFGDPDERAPMPPHLAATTLLGRRIGDAFAEFAEAMTFDAGVAGPIIGVATSGTVEVNGEPHVEVRLGGDHLGESIRVGQLAQALENLADARDDIRDAAKLADLAGVSDGGTGLRLMRAMDDVEAAASAIGEQHVELAARST